MLRRTSAARFASVGATLSGFKCVRVEPQLSDLADPQGVPMQGSLWENEQTGTRVIFFNARERPNQQQGESAAAASSTAVQDAGEKACAISFCTPAENDSGATHILEHTVLCGSDKFPTVRDPFFKMLRRSLSTFMNAMTSPSTTVYPFSTCNERDFFNILEVYLDCTLHPLIRPLDFAQEAHRLKFAPPATESQQETAAASSSSCASKPPLDASRLQRTGVVLNEMKGAMSDPLTYFYTEQGKHAFAGSPYALCFGGAPAAIPKLSHADLVSYYARHYQRPVIALYDSSVAGEGSKRDFLQRTLDKILTEVAKPRKVVAASDSASGNGNGSDISALERLRQLRLAAKPTTMVPGRPQFAFSWGPADPMQQQQDGAAAGGDAAAAATTTSRIGFYRPLVDLVQNKDCATRDDHKALFRLSLLMHILLRPPSGPLYRELLHNGDNTAALASLDIAVVQRRVAELELAASLSPDEAEVLRAHREEKRRGAKQAAGDAAESPASGGTTLDLLPGCGLDSSVQTPGFFVGLQNVPAFADSRTADDAAASAAARDKNAELLRLKARVISLAVLCTLQAVAHRGLDAGLVEGALHEYELSLRTRSRTFAVNAAISATGAYTSGRDPFWSLDDTAIDNEIAAELKPTLQHNEESDAATTRFFSDFIREQLLFNADDEAIKTVAVAGSRCLVEREAAEEEAAMSELRAQMAAEGKAAELRAVHELEQALLEAQKRVDDGGSLPTLQIADIAREPVNFSPAVHVIGGGGGSSNINSNSTSMLQRQPVQSFVANTAGLAYVRLLLPLHDVRSLFVDCAAVSKQHKDGEGAEDYASIALPLFTFLMDKLGTESLSVAMQDVAVRSVCSGFSCGITLASLPSSNGDSAAQQPLFSAVRALQINFHAMPENVPKALELLQLALKANASALWGGSSGLVASDAERKAMLIQLLTMYATDVESSVMHNGTSFATSEALLGAVEAASTGAAAGTGDAGSAAAAAARRAESVLQNYGDWNGLGAVGKLTRLRNAVTELQQAAASSGSGDAALEALSFLFPAFERFARCTLQSNAGATGYCVAGPRDHVAVAEHIEAFLQQHVRGNGSGSNDGSGVSSDPLVVTALPLYAQRRLVQKSEVDAAVAQAILQRPLPGASTTFVGCVLPTPLHSEHELTPALQLALRIASQEFLHREIREIGGAYGSGARLGAGDFGASSGLVSFTSYRDPSPERTIGIFRDGAIRDWFRANKPDERVMREAKLSLFGAIDAPLPPHSVGERTAVSRVSRELLAKQRQRLLDATADDVLRAVETVLDPAVLRRDLTACVVGKVAPTQ